MWAQLMESPVVLQLQIGLPNVGVALHILHSLQNLTIAVHHFCLNLWIMQHLDCTKNEVIIGST